MFKHFAHPRRKEDKLINTVVFSGSWVNELGSEMIITTDGERINGKYSTKVGDANPEKEFDLVGFVNDGLLSFSVNFSENKTLSSWVGHYTNENGIEVIKTMWLLAKYVEDDKNSKEIWGSVWNGYNNFTRKK